MVYVDVSETTFLLKRNQAKCFESLVKNVMANMSFCKSTYSRMRLSQARRRSSQYIGAPLSTRASMLAINQFAVNNRLSYRVTTQDNDSSGQISTLSIGKLVSMTYVFLTEKVTLSMYSAKPCSCN